jgi:putative DNA primase/helicase
MSNLSSINKYLQTNAPVDDIRSQLLNRLEPALFHLYPNGVSKYGKFHIGDVDGIKGRSLKIELNAPKAGLWRDFATNEGSDIFGLWAKARNIDIKSDFPRLMEEIKNWLGVHSPSQGSVESVNSPTNKNANNDNFGKPSAEWSYTDVHGNIVAKKLRYDLDGEKRYLPWDEKRKKYKFPEIRPLYNLPGIAKSDQVILVEGEKCAQALIDKGICATTAMGGANADISKTDWSPLKEKDVIIWPDNDPPGKAYAQKARTKLLEIGVSSLKIIEIPVDKIEKWDAANAIAEGIDPQQFIGESIKKDNLTEDLLPSYGGEAIWDDLSVAPEDIISPSILIPESLLVFGGAPKVGKTNFLMTWMVHMAAGLPFMGMRPARPLKIFYLQAELSYHSFKKRLQKVVIDQDHKLIAKKNLAMTPKLNIQLNEQGINLAYKTIYRHFKNEVDIIVIDPLRNFFDGGVNNASENDNVAMMLFLQKRLEYLRNKLNPKAGIILAHHTRKITKNYLEEETFQALSGASALRGYYTTGIILYRPDEKKAQRQLIFELREGEEIAPKSIEMIVGGWRELEDGPERLANQKLGKKYDDERRRKQDVILQLIDERAAQGSVYTMQQFCEEFENKAGLGGEQVIRKRINVLATRGYIKFFKDVEKYLGLPKPTGSKFGYMCVKDMHLRTQDGNETLVHPTDYKCNQTGAALPVENPKIWVCSEELCN